MVGTCLARHSKKLPLIKRSIISTSRRTLPALVWRALFFRRLLHFSTLFILPMFVCVGVWGVYYTLSVSSTQTVQESGCFVCFLRSHNFFHFPPLGKATRLHLGAEICKNTNKLREFKSVRRARVLCEVGEKLLVALKWTMANGKNAARGGGEYCAVHLSAALVTNVGFHV